MRKHTLTSYLMKYYKIQDKILLVYRPTLTTGWNNRCLYLSAEYNPVTKYNHRTILENEVVIEFDEEDKKENQRLARIVSARVRNDKIPVSVWNSGNKSVHVHFFVDLQNAKNVQLLKKVIIRYYSEGLPLPDLRMAVSNHLIRAEYGVHEKTGNLKVLLNQDDGYPALSRLPPCVWEKYTKEMFRVVKGRTTRDVNDLVENPKFQTVLTSEVFRKFDDGRERALFMLIHVLKEKYKDDKQGLVKYLQEWYRYSGGFKLSDEDIERKIGYHWGRTYCFGEKYLNELMESVESRNFKKE